MKKIYKEINNKKSNIYYIYMYKIHQSIDLSHTHFLILLTY